MQVRNRLPNRRVVGLFLALMSVVIVVVGGLFVPAAGAQDAPVAPVAPAPAAGATSDAPLVTSGPDQLGERVSESETATKRLNMAVIGLLGLAAVITVATVVFWKLSAPVPEERTAVSPAFRIEFIGDQDPSPPAVSAAATAPAWLSTSPPTPTTAPSEPVRAGLTPSAPDVTMEPVAPIAGAWASQGWGTDS
jgi:hypothetical protein